MKKIVIVTSGQPSANPRVVKEATALDAAGYLVTVVYAPLSPWADEFDRQLFAETPNIRWIKVGYHLVKQRHHYSIIRLRRKLNDCVSQAVPSLNIAPENAFIFYAQELKKKSAQIKADLYIAHNLGALPAAVMAAKKHGAKCAFDAEDFHRGEDYQSKHQQQIAITIEDKYIPQLNYLSAASPLISKAYQQLYLAAKVVTLNNVFSKKHLQNVNTNAENGLSLFWFSQVIGANRGLELIVEAMNKKPSLNISLHLLGSINDTYKTELLEKIHRPDTLRFYSPMPLEEIFSLAAKFDVGLASEVPHCLNRELCLTNKLFTYLLAGNYVLASDTPAQKLFLQTYPKAGALYSAHNAEETASLLEQLYYDKEHLLEGRLSALALGAEKFNWEEESKKLIEVIKSTLNEIEEHPHYIAALPTV